MAMKIPEIAELLVAAESQGIKVFVVGSAVYTGKVSDEQYGTAKAIIENADGVIELYALRRCYRQLAEDKTDPREMVRVGRRLGIKFEVSRLHIGSPFTEHYGRITKTGVTFPDYVPPKAEPKKAAPKTAKKQVEGANAFSDGKVITKHTNKNFVQDGPDLFATAEESKDG